MTKPTMKSLVTEFLIGNQGWLKDECMKLAERRDYHLSKENPVFRDELALQYDARIKQQLACIVAEALAIPSEYVIIQLERIDLEKYLNV